MLNVKQLLNFYNLPLDDVWHKGGEEPDGGGRTDGRAQVQSLQPSKQNGESGNQDGRYQAFFGRPIL